MGNTATVNVSIFVPNGSVASMQDEVQDGSVQAAVKAATAAYLGVDSDRDIPVREYDEDFDNAIAAATKYADTTEGVDVIVVITDLVCDDPARAERLLKESGDMFVIVPVSNQGYDETWAAKLDNDAAGPNNVDVISVADLANPQIAMAEVGPFLSA
jgi:2-phospho-L-lactate guanylyltransferase (CobY/MobA/RfbA family)